MSQEIWCTYCGGSGTVLESQGTNDDFPIYAHVQCNECGGPGYTLSYVAGFVDKPKPKRKFNSDQERNALIDYCFAKAEAMHEKDPLKREAKNTYADKLHMVWEELKNGSN